MLPSRLCHAISFWLREYPWMTNVTIGTTIGFSADIFIQGVVKKIPREKEAVLPQDVSPLVVECPRILHKLRIRLSGDRDSQVALIDLRRSFIFSSFTILFNTYFFLAMYKWLDAVFPPSVVTRRTAIVKGFLSWVGANATTPLYLAYVAAMSHYFIHRTGRRQFDAAESGGVGWVVDFPIFFGEVKKQVKQQLREDWPDMMRYGIFFWGLNWLPMFYYIPPHFRYVYGSSLQVVWSAIMSHLMHRGVKVI
ncbi:hypothetical protein DQ04_04891030 [Trypanosoma grayi]|uniref:hypothetical protein n=1 Tax=Trypanosoma grayi TaxID=71804 RepID=UPI0004F42744|nr:hypothetical protein DQ04_04891030 [Trypanosoma grayi]KEG09642.1 hypothetical protein DQ04_04891030 [Trypanosoma grayi]